MRPRAAEPSSKMGTGGPFAWSDQERVVAWAVHFTGAVRLGGTEGRPFRSGYENPLKKFLEQRGRGKAKWLEGCGVSFPAEGFLGLPNKSGPLARPPLPQSVNFSQTSSTGHGTAISCGHSGPHDWRWGGLFAGPADGTIWEACL